jgi:glutathione synthase/RimK-type ligase-like ATP-grasp enzyme
MPTLIVVSSPKDWPLDIPGVEVVSGRTYLTDPTYSESRGIKVFNLCRSYRYQSIGYYVSLLAEARGHKPLPNITTIQDLKSLSMVRFVSDDLDELIQKALAPIQSEKFTLSCYFGRNLARRYDRLSLHLFNLFQAPLLRAQFVNHKKWQLQSIQPISASEIPDDHLFFVGEVAKEHLAGRRPSVRRRTVSRYDLAILYDPAERTPPSNERALQRFMKSAESLGLGAELITKDDYGRLAEFDALFIRETTSVNHHTYRFARRAVAEGLVAIDDPESIVKCANKVYLAELLDHHEIPTPKTLVVHRDNIDRIFTELGVPCILKQPDSSFSQGVIKVENEEALIREVERMLEKSDLIIAQEFAPTDFDWRVGILDRQPLFVCKYHMASRHWQITRWDGAGNGESGRVESIPVELAPKQVVRTALKAANLIGDGLYGVDLKQVPRSDGGIHVIEINDNPNIDAGYEDTVLKEQLYARVMGSFLRRVERRKEPTMRW